MGRLGSGTHLVGRIESVSASFQKNPAGSVLTTAKKGSLRPGGSFRGWALTSYHSVTSSCCTQRLQLLTSYTVYPLIKAVVMEMSSATYQDGTQSPQSADRRNGTTEMKKRTVGDQWVSSRDYCIATEDERCRQWRYCSGPVFHSTDSSPASLC